MDIGQKFQIQCFVPVEFTFHKIGENTEIKLILRDSRLSALFFEDQESPAELHKDSAFRVVVVLKFNCEQSYGS